MVKRILLGLLALIVIVILGLVIYIQLSWNKTYDWAAPALKVSQDSSVIAYGKYLVTGPAHCVSCHVASFDELSDADNGKEVALKGGIEFKLGPLGKLYTANLTPDPKTGIGRFSDEQIFRMMRHAIRPNGLASSPLLMPFFKMADQDLVAIVSYLRSQKPVENSIPDAQFTFIGKAVRCFTPTFKPVKEDAPKNAPPMTPTVERGAYLANYVTNCVGCHTQRDQMTYQPIGPEFAGGMEFEPWKELYAYLKVDPDLWLRSPNITPDPNSALSRFKTADEFIKRFRQGRIISYSPMDWGPFSRMSEEDLTAIWMYLNSLKPVKKDVGELVFKKN